MKKILIAALAALALAVAASAQTQSAPGSQTPAPGAQTQPSAPPAQAPTGAQPQPSAPPAQAPTLGTQTQPSGPPPPPPHPAGLKAPPQAKTQEEYTAFTTAANAINSPDPAAAEAAAKDFQAKYPNSELTSQLYMQLLFKNIQANDSEKAIAMGQEVLKLDPTNPVAAIYTGLILAESTRTTDMDSAQRFDEAAKDANVGLQNVETNLMLAANVPQAQVDATKADLRSRAYDTLGLVAFKRNDFVTAEKDFRQSIQVRGEPGEAMTHLRLALSLDKQNKYNDALTEADKAVSLANPQDTVAKSAQAEVDRLKKLTGAGASTAPAAPPAAPPSH